MESKIVYKKNMESEIVYKETRESNTREMLR